MAKKKSITKVLFTFDGQYEGLVAGVDEAGRGPLAGPVVAAACIMPRDNMIDRIFDSKQVLPAVREELYDAITATAVAYKIAVIEHTVIDEINILNATKRAMREAVEGLGMRPDVVLIDAVKLDLGVRVVPIVKGDEKSYAIAAASILAKVYRDRLMDEYAALYPGYGFERHKGYATPEHVRAIGEKGQCPIHRLSFHLKEDALERLETRTAKYKCGDGHEKQA